MDQANQGILKHRQVAAELSRGISSDPVYDAIQRAIAEMDLRGRVLDYGAGTGNLSRRLLSLDRFEEVAAADILPLPEDLRGKVDWIAQDLNEPVTNRENHYDVVIAAEVIEHLENPRAMARDLYRILRPGGTVIISTPNNESWRSISALVVRGHFVAFGDTCYPAHIVALVRKDLERILLEAGFDRARFRFTDDGGLPGKPSVTWQTVTFGALRGLRFSDNVIVIAAKA